MLKPENRFPLNSISLALLATLAMSPLQLVAQESEEEVIDEVVTTGTRLKGTATAVLEERKNQAFVADILGADQISRTGDGDAASALRRVTGLTLVDGQFIYVRGLGERYSSTALNGAAVPSPDPTRNVIPLDLFPSDIIESLSVQKSYSPSMPAAFGGGSIDIRIKSIPTEYTFSVNGGIGWNTENSGDAFSYAGNDDFLGDDGGLRAAPSSIVSLWEDRSFFNEQLTQDQARSLLTEINRNYDPVEDDANPDGSFGVTLGNSYDIDSKWRVGFLSSIGYAKSTEVSEQFELNIPGQVQGRFDPDNPENIFDDIQSTQTNTKWSGLFNFGVDYNRNHRVAITIATIALIIA
ncbi:MAG: TonB-dependent receptor plug domain-containing protein [Pseudomonadota bacterium]